MTKKPYSPKNPRRKYALGPDSYRGWLESSPLRNAREKAGLTQQALATIATTSAVTLRALEQGAWKTSDVFPQLERALGMPPGRLAKQYRTWLRRRPGSAQEGKGKGNGSAAEA